MALTRPEKDIISLLLKRVETLERQIEDMQQRTHTTVQRYSGVDVSVLELHNGVVYINVDDSTLHYIDQDNDYRIVGN